MYILYVVILFKNFKMRVNAFQCEWDHYSIQCLGFVNSAKNIKASDLYITGDNYNTTCEDTFQLIYFIGILYKVTCVRNNHIRWLCLVSY